ncbi:MAG: hemin uptake protein HemP [Pirellulales bacterium]
MSGEEPQPSNHRRDEKQPSPRRIVYRADELMQGRREVWIEHADEMYRLRVTSAGKLYLTK